MWPRFLGPQHDPLKNYSSVSGTKVWQFHFPTQGNPVTIKFPLCFRYLGKDWKVIVKSQLLYNLADKQNSGFPFKNEEKPTNQQKPTMTWGSSWLDLSDSVRDGVSGCSDGPSGNAVFLEEEKEALTECRFAHELCEEYQLPHTSKMLPSSEWTVWILCQI